MKTMADKMRDRKISAAAWLELLAAAEDALPVVRADSKKRGQMNPFARLYEAITALKKDNS